MTEDTELSPIEMRFLQARMKHAYGALRSLYRQLESSRTQARKNKIIHRINFWIAQVQGMIADERRRERNRTEVSSVPTAVAGGNAEEVSGDGSRES